MRVYERHLKAVERWKPASVNLALGALDSFYPLNLAARPDGHRPLRTRARDTPEAAPETSSRA